MAKPMKIESLEQLKVEALKPKRYPLDCGCKGPAFESMCDAHATEFQADARRYMGIPELMFTHHQLTDVIELGKTLHSIRLRLIENPTKSLLVKIIP